MKTISLVYISPEWHILKFCDTLERLSLVLRRGDLRFRKIAIKDLVKEGEDFYENGSIPMSSFLPDLP